jgi:signal transduction histidine kinase
MFDFKTLAYYGVAGALSFCLSILLVAFARVQPGTRSVHTSALAILVMAVAYMIAAYGPSFPRWTMVLGTNMMLLAAAEILHTGFVAFCEDRRPPFDRTGWAIVLITAFPFWYWGLVEPDGNLRSAVFSFATALITVRTAILLIKYARQSNGSIATWAMAILFCIVTLWMTLRGFSSLQAETPPQPLRGANPTTWVSVVSFIVLITLISATAMWMEIDRLRGPRIGDYAQRSSALGIVGTTRRKLLLLWSAALVLTVGIVVQVGSIYTVFYDAERDRLMGVSEIANDAFVEHTVQILNRADTLLQSVRSFYLTSRSIHETERFLSSLKFDRSLIDNVYIISAEGRIALSNDISALGRSVADRDYFPFHRDTAEDVIHVSTVELGRVTGKYHFRISRRIYNSDGSFGGLLLATVAPEHLSHFYQELLQGEGMVASLVGTIDHKLRSRAPEQTSSVWSQVIDSAVWEKLEVSDSGSYESVSTIDGVRRAMTYRKVPGFPLVMITGFAAGDLLAGIFDRIKWTGVSAAIIILGVLAMAALLTLEIRRRAEQDHFMSMLNHELKTPLSVIRMSVGDKDVPLTIRERIARAVNDMNTVVERSLQADRLQYGTVTNEKHECRVGELLNARISMSADPSRVMSSISELPSVKTDYQLLGVILTNLIDNALKYSPDRALIRITAGEAKRMGRNGIVITVSNPPGTAGMPDAREVFRKYYRAAGAHGRTGSGLGLYIAAGFSEKIGGKLRYVPASDEVKFELWIPR